ncbi:MAG: peptidase [Bacteroidetes bacterium]|nr:MAG: peptidase [Bacteroidota bacterium]
MLQSYFPALLDTPLESVPPTAEGRSREGRPLPAYRFGRGDFLISLIAGCHADEPTGPRLLKKLVAFLHHLPPEHELLQRFTWYVVPHANPDGEARNRSWYSESDETYHFGRYVQHVVRELPGDDVEYGFPIEGQAPPLRPENAFIYAFWRSAGRPFHLHASLHSMGIAYGAWFLIDAAWVLRSELIQQRCREAAWKLGHPLHDVERQGEKGFHRIAEGFCTRPDSESMKRFFLERGDPETAAKFHPSSMESIRSLGGDCLTLVSELPLFLIPRESKALTWPDPEFETWKTRLGRWRSALESGALSPEAVDEEARALGLRPMPVRDQMLLQWTFLSSGVACRQQQEEKVP